MSPARRVLKTVALDKQTQMYCFYEHDETGYESWRSAPRSCLCLLPVARAPVEECSKELSMSTASRSGNKNHSL